MSELALSIQRQEVFVGMEFGPEPANQRTEAASIDAEVKRIVDECYVRAQRILTSTETADRRGGSIAGTLACIKEFEAVMEGEPLPPRQ